LELIDSLALCCQDNEADGAHESLEQLEADTRDISWHLALDVEVLVYEDFKGTENGSYDTVKDHNDCLSCFANFLNFLVCNNGILDLVLWSEESDDHKCHDDNDDAKSVHKADLLSIEDI